MIISKVYKGTIEFTKGYKRNTLIFQSHKPLAFTYTGEWRMRPITYDGVDYTLLILIDDGTLTFNRSVSVDI